MINPTEHKIALITAVLKYIEVPNLEHKQSVLTLITEHGKMYHLQIKPLKTAKKPLIRTLINFTEGYADMQTLLNELNHSIK